MVSKDFLNCVKIVLLNLIYNLIHATAFGSLQELIHSNSPSYNLFVSLSSSVITPGFLNIPSSL